MRLNSDVFQIHDSFLRNSQTLQSGGEASSFLEKHLSGNPIYPYSLPLDCFQTKSFLFMEYLYSKVNILENTKISKFEAWN